MDTIFGSAAMMSFNMVRLESSVGICLLCEFHEMRVSLLMPARYV